MQTKNIVQTSANVIRITNLKSGDIYKRFDDSSYSNSTYYGIVKSIYNNGERTFIESVEYKYSYGKVEANLYIIRDDKDVAIFPATLEELQNDFEGSVRKIEKDIEDKEEEIKKLNKALEMTKKLVSGQLQQELSTPEYKELTQSEFNSRMQAIASESL